MAALQITYGGSSYNVTRLDIIDLIPFQPVFLQDAQKLFENNVTRLDIIDTSSITEPVFLQDAQKLFENNITRLDIIDTSSITEPIFLQGGVASPNAQTTGGAAQETSKESWE